MSAYLSTPKSPAAFRLVRETFIGRTTSPPCCAYLAVQSPDFLPLDCSGGAPTVTTTRSTLHNIYYCPRSHDAKGPTNWIISGGAWRDPLVANFEHRIRIMSLQYAMSPESSTQGSHWLSTSECRQELARSRMLRANERTGYRAPRIWHMAATRRESCTQRQSTANLQPSRKLHERWKLLAVRLST